MRWDPSIVRRAGPRTPSGSGTSAWLPACLALAISLACSDAATREDFASRPPQPVTVELTRVVPELLHDEVALTGQLEAEFSVVVKPEIEGVIETIEFQEGKPVELGAVLFHLRDAEQRARHAEAEAGLRLAQDVFDRTQRLTNQDISSIARRAEAASARDQAIARVSLTKLDLDRTRIRAPFSGVTDARLVAPGDRVEPEDGLVTVAAVDRLQLVFTVQELGVALARTGATIHARVIAYPGERFQGEVFFVAPRVDPASRRLVLKAWIPNADHRLKPGMFANVDVQIATRQDALLVPEAALVYDRNGSYVWRVGDDQLAEKVPVETGLRQGGRVEIVRGIRAGDRVVSAGTHKLMAGKRVRPAPGSPVEHARESAPEAVESGAES